MGSMNTEFSSGSGPTDLSVSFLSKRWNFFLFRKFIYGSFLSMEYYRAGMRAYMHAQDQTNQPNVILVLYPACYYIVSRAQSWINVAWARSWWFLIQSFWSAYHKKLYVVLSSINIIQGEQFSHACFLAKKVMAATRFKWRKKGNYKNYLQLNFLA